MVEECFGKVAKNNVDEIRADHLPAILIAYKVKGNTEIRNIIQGSMYIKSGPLISVHYIHVIMYYSIVIQLLQYTYNYIHACTCICTCYLTLPFLWCNFQERLILTL